jgi:hypothetical protein
MKPELAGLPPLIAAAWRATTALRLAAEVAHSQSLCAVGAHLNDEADALLGAIRCAEPYAKPEIAS